MILAVALAANWIYIELALRLHMESVVLNIDVFSLGIHCQMVLNILFERTCLNMQ